MRLAPFAGHDQGSTKYKWRIKNAVSKKELSSFFGSLDNLSIDTPGRMKAKELDPQTTTVATRSGKYGKNYKLDEEGNRLQDTLVSVDPKQAEKINQYYKSRVSMLKNKQAMPGLSQVR